MKIVNLQPCTQALKRPRAFSKMGLKSFLDAIASLALGLDVSDLKSCYYFANRGGNKGIRGIWGIREALGV